MEYDYFYIDSANNRQGPCKREALKDNGVKAASPVWREGLDSWMKAFEIPELKDLFEEEYYQRFMPGTEAGQDTQEFQQPEIPAASPSTEDKTDDGQIKIQNVQDKTSYKPTDKEKREHMPGCLLIWLWFLFSMLLISCAIYGWLATQQVSSEQQTESLTTAVVSAIVAYAIFLLIRWKRRGLYIYLVVTAIALTGCLISGDPSSATGLIVHASILYYYFRVKPINENRFPVKKYLWDYMD